MKDNLVKVAINGMGRIGRTILREYFDRTITEFDIVAINNPGDLKNFLHLLKHDSVHGPFKGDLKLLDNNLIINGKAIKFFNYSDPSLIPWSDCGVQMVIDATGVFKDRLSLMSHCRGTVKKVILTAPGLDLDGMFVVGVNSHTYDPGIHHLISNASCTTNCLTPIVKVLDDQLGIESGFMTTVHSYTLDQALLDSYHADPRRSRAAGLSIIPTTSGATLALGEIIPHLKGKIEGYAVRVPTPNVSLIDLTLNIKKQASVQNINDILDEASKTTMKGILRYESEELVSIDYTGMRHSACIDSSLTKVIGNNIKLVAWYDNEYGFSNRLLDLLILLTNKGL